MCAIVSSEAASGRFRRVLACAIVGSGGRFRRVPVCVGVGAGGRARKVPESYDNIVHTDNYTTAVGDTAKAYFSI